MCLIPAFENIEDGVHHSPKVTAPVLAAQYSYSYIYCAPCFAVLMPPVQERL